MNRSINVSEEIRRQKAGFSLIEIMLVVAIMGMLAAVVAVGLSSRQKIARVNITRTSISAIGQAVELYEMDIGRIPDSLDNLLKSSGEPNWNGPYIKSGVIQPDAWGSPFSYSKKGESAFEVRSAGPDRALNNEDDVTN